MPEFSEQSLAGIPTNMFYLIKAKVRSFCVETSFFICFHHSFFYFQTLCLFFCSALVITFSVTFTLKIQKIKKQWWKLKCWKSEMCFHSSLVYYMFRNESTINNRYIRKKNRKLVNTLRSSVASERTVYCTVV